jgi:hypothetical protein
LLIYKWSFLSGFLIYSVEIVECAKDKELKGFPLLWKFLADDRRDSQVFPTSHSVSAEVFQSQKVKTVLLLEFLSVLLNFVVCVASSLLNMTILHSTCYLLPLLQIAIKPQ